MTTGAIKITGAERAAEVRTAKGLVWLWLDFATLNVKRMQGAPEALLGDPPGSWERPGFLLDRLDPRDSEAGRALLMGSAGTADPAVAELRMTRADGGVVWVQICRLMNTTADGEMLVSLLNIDEQVLVERTMAQAVDAMRDALMTTSYEIAQPANAISDYGGLLERHLSTQADDVGSEYALGIREAVERMKVLSDTLQRVGRKAAPTPGRGVIGSGGR